MLLLKLHTFTGHSQIDFITLLFLLEPNRETGNNKGNDLIFTVQYVLI